MTAYVVVDINVTDPVGYEEYKKLAPPSLAAYGGNMSHAAGAPKHSRAAGRRAAW